MQTQTTSPILKSKLLSNHRLHLFIAALFGMLLLTGCERPPMHSVQHGYRGTGMVQVYNPRTLEDQAELNAVPVALPVAPTDGPRAGQVYQNVQVLSNISTAQFGRLMVSMTSWVAPQQGCGYCHNLANFAEDSKYQKVVARRMIQMTQHVNLDWKQHVSTTGVTCYTCHRGNNIPTNVWFTKDPQPTGADFIGDKAGQNEPSEAVGLSSLPNDPFTPFLLGASPIRVNGPTALPSGNVHSIKQTEWTYGLMEHMAGALGVNCTYCHNTHSFQSWEDSPPQRVTAWYGIRMARNLNSQYMLPLTDTFPEHRKGELGDVAKLNCATCHQGAYKPLYGAKMLLDFPELAGYTASPERVSKK
jgi:photosynthetic reaction center cytochrome c subunit